MNVVETIRSEAMHSVMGIASVKAAWPGIKYTLRQQLPDASQLTSRDVFRLGDILSDAFRHGGAGRGQGAVSSAGAVWESLVAWYINICCCGTRAVVIKSPKTLVPRSIDKALTVTHESSSLRSETDLILVYLDSSTLDAEVSTRSKARKAYSQAIADNFGMTSVVNIQCKTNWNDSAQIPMLWNMVYSPKFTHPVVTIGVNGYSIKSLKAFRYAFVTVPTQKDLGKFASDSLAVLRVKTLSGGAYWGWPTKPSVCLSVKEIFSKNQGSNDLPSVTAMGQGYAEAAKASSVKVDWQVFDLY